MTDATSTPGSTTSTGDAAAGGSPGSSPGPATTGRGPRRRPTHATVLRTQVRLLARRRIRLVVVALVLAGTVVLPATDVLGLAPTTLADAIARSWTIFGVVALFWGPGVAWADEGPSDRAYHWTLPVDRPVHQMWRTAAGWLVLVGVLAAGTAAGWLVGAVLQGGMAPGDPAVLAGVLPSATVLYLVGGVFALTTDRPLLWLVVAYVAATAAQGLVVFEGWAWLAELVREVFFSGSLSLTAAASVPATVAGPAAGSSVAGSPWQAAGLWLAVVAGLTAAAAGLHLERSGEG